MPSRKLTLQRLGASTQPPTHPRAPTSWPLARYAVAEAALSGKRLSPWATFPHQDGIFLVIATGHPVDLIQPEIRQTRLKVVWQTEVLEDVDLATLVQQTNPSSTFGDGSQLTNLVVGRSPSLAIRYLREGKSRRFQVKLTSQESYQSVIASLGQENCIVRPPQDSQGLGEQASQELSMAPLLGPNQRPPPTTPIPHIPNSSSSVITPTPPENPSPLRSGYVHAVGGQGFLGSSPISMAPPPRGSPEPQQEPTYTGFTGNYPSSQQESGPMGSGIRLPQCPQELGYTRGAVDCPPAPLGSPGPRPMGTELGPPWPSQGMTLGRDYSSSSYKSPPIEYEALLRQQPSLGSGREPETYDPGPAGSGSALGAQLPPLRKPTPVGSRSALSRSWAMASPTQYPTPNSDYSAGPSGQSGVSSQFGREAVAPAPAGLHATTRDQGQQGMNQVPNSASPHPAGGPHIPTTTADARLTNTGEKRNQQGDDSRVQGQQKKQKTRQVEDNPACEEEDLAQVEDFIVNAIHDDSFLKLVERIGGVWQRMGFDRAVPRLFTDLPDRKGE